jgi:hypothetical protein
VKSRVGSSLWQVDIAFKVQFFFFLSEVLLYGFHRGHLSLTLVQTSSGSFVKRMILLIYWNEISDCYSISSVSNIDLVFFILSLHLLLHLLYLEKLYKILNFTTIFYL